LMKKAARLNETKIEKPTTLLGKNTKDSLNIGFYYGFLKMVDGLVIQFKEILTMNTKSKVLVIATGGFSEFLAKDSLTIDVVEPFLTLEGLRLCYLRNKK